MCEGIGELKPMSEVPLNIEVVAEQLLIRKHLVRCEERLTPTLVMLLVDEIIALERIMSELNR